MLVNVDMCRCLTKKDINRFESRVLARGPRGTGASKRQLSFRTHGLHAGTLLPHPISQKPSGASNDPKNTPKRRIHMDSQQCPAKIAFWAPLGTPRRSTWRCSRRG